MVGILALALVFTLFFAGCEEDSTEKKPKDDGGDSSSSVHLPKIGDPKVDFKVVKVTTTTAPYISYNVELKWEPVIEAETYRVWRSGGGQTVPKIIKPEVTDTDADGMYYYTDKGIKVDTQYTYTVQSIPHSAVKDLGKWEKTITTTYIPIFGEGASLSLKSFEIAENGILAEDGTSVTGFWVLIDLKDIKPQSDVTYTIERAILDIHNKPINFETVTLYDTYNSTTPFDLTEKTKTDIFGNSPTLTTACDKSLPVKEDNYEYRIKGVKGDVTDYIKANVNLQIDFTTYFQKYISLEIGNKIAETDSSPVYKITPKFDLPKGRRGLLQDSDKLVLYWIVGPADCYKTGPYKHENTISFTKNQIEAALSANPQNTRNLPIPEKTVANNSLYIQAYIELANGDKLILTNLTGDGLKTDNPPNPKQTINGQEHYQLKY